MLEAEISGEQTLVHGKFLLESWYLSLILNYFVLGKKKIKWYIQLSLGSF